MITFPSLPQRTIIQRQRTNQQQIQATAVKKRLLANDIIENSNTATVPFSIGNGVTLTLTSRTTTPSELTSDVRMGSMPYMITFYEAATLAAINPGTNQIPNDVATGRYTITQLAMPEYTVDGARSYIDSGNTIYFATDGNDVVCKTSISNNSGGTRDIIALVQFRVLQNAGAIDQG